MKLRMVSAFVLSLGFGAALFAGCGGGSDTGSGAACKLSSDCASSELCIKVGSASTCTANCTASVDACGASAGCEGVGSVGVSVCQPKKPAPSAENPPDPKEQPSLPCASDAECSKLHPGAVCAQWHGARDCTIPCMNDAPCNPPAVGGIGTSFFACQADESNMSRTVCLPKDSCFNDPLSCITGLPTGSSSSSGFPSGSGSGVGGFGM